MKNLLFHSIVLAAVFAVIPNANSAFGQFRPGPQSAQPKSSSQSQSQESALSNVGIQPESQTKQGLVQSSAQTRGVAGTSPGMQVAPAIETQRPWKLASRIHLEKGTNQGYLVVQLDLDEGYHIYSLSSDGSPSPTRLVALPSKDLRMISKFASDKSPIVIAKDPVFEQRIEKHKGQIQFFASIEVRPGVDLQKLTQEVQLSGQVCSDSACQPIRKQAVNAKFAGFFEIPKLRNAGSAQQIK